MKEMTQVISFFYSYHLLTICFAYNSFFWQLAARQNYVFLAYYISAACCDPVLGSIGCARLLLPPTAAGFLIEIK